MSTSPVPSPRTHRPTEHRVPKVYRPTPLTNTGGEAAPAPAPRGIPLMVWRIPTTLSATDAEMYTLAQLIRTQTRRHEHVLDLTPTPQRLRVIAAQGRHGTGIVPTDAHAQRIQIALHGLLPREARTTVNLRARQPHQIPADLASNSGRAALILTNPETWQRHPSRRLLDSAITALQPGGQIVILSPAHRHAQHATAPPVALDHAELDQPAHVLAVTTTPSIASSCHRAGVRLAVDADLWIFSRIPQPAGATVSTGVVRAR